MSIDERLRTGLALNTDHLLVDVEHELATTYGRARRRRLRWGGLALAAAAAVGAIAWFGGVPGLDGDAAPVAPDPTPGPRDLVGLQGPLEPGTYAMAAWGEDEQVTGPLPRVVLDVPAGWFGYGGYVVGAGFEGTTDDQYGDISAWHVVQVLADPCRRSTATVVGPTVDDLAQALADQAGPNTPPEPVTLDGHTGVSMTVTVPPDTDLDKCYSGEYSLWRTEPRGDSAYSPTTPGLANHLWILDVDGTRLVLVAALHPDESPALHQEQLEITESARFVDGGP